MISNTLCSCSVAFVVQTITVGAQQVIAVIMILAEDKINRLLHTNCC